MNPTAARRRTQTPGLDLWQAAVMRIDPNRADRLLLPHMRGVDAESPALRRSHDELHWILQYDRRQRRSESIVAWFDKHMKDDVAWWGHRWPEDE